jgi:hypothetical protein
MPAHDHFIDPAYGTDVPLFELPPPATDRSDEPQRRPKTLGWAPCPLHPYAGRSTGLVIVGAHLVWVVHGQTIGRSRVVCRASGVSICDLPPRPDDVTGNVTMRVALSRKKAATDTGIRSARCPHQHGGRQ